MWIPGDPEGRSRYRQSGVSMEPGEIWWASQLAILQRASLPLTIYIHLIVNPVGSSFRIFLESDYSSSLPLYTIALAIIISYLDQCHGLRTGLPVFSPDTIPPLDLCICSFSAWSSSPTCPWYSHSTSFGLCSNVTSLVKPSSNPHSQKCHTQRHIRFFLLTSLANFSSLCYTPYFFSLAVCFFSCFPSSP